MDENYWWHAFGAVAPSGVFVLVIAGETTKMEVSLWHVIPDPLDEDIEFPIAYLKSWRHEPSTEEKDALTPPGWETEAHEEK